MTKGSDSQKNRLPQIVFRLEEDLMAQVDAHVKRLERDRDPDDVRPKTRSDAVRDLIKRGLADTKKSR